MTPNAAPGDGVPTRRGSRGGEPIRKPWLWVGLVVIILAGIPWYLPAGTIDPRVFGVPLWTLVAVASSIVLCAYLTWVVSRHWNLVEDQEEEDAAGTSEPPGEGR